MHRGVGPEFFRKVREDETRRDRVDSNAVLTPLHRHASRHRGNRRFAHRIRLNSLQRSKRVERINVDHRSRGLLFDHPTSHLLGHQEGSFEVDVEDAVKLVDGIRLDPLSNIDARHIQQAIDRSCSLRHCFHHPGNVVWLSYIADDVVDRMSTDRNFFGCAFECR